MKINMGALDRILRLVVGIAILVLGYTYQTWWGLVGLVPLGTAAIGWCPVYLPFGLSTCKKPASTET